MSLKLSKYFRFRLEKFGILLLNGKTMKYFTIDKKYYCLLTEWKNTNIIEQNKVNLSIKEKEISDIIEDFLKIGVIETV
jgi:hypothetical protein